LIEKAKALKAASAKGQGLLQKKKKLVVTKRFSPMPSSFRPATILSPKSAVPPLLTHPLTLPSHHQPLFEN